MNDIVSDFIDNYVIIASLKSEPTYKLINKMPGPGLLISQNKSRKLPDMTEKLHSCRVLEVEGLLVRASLEQHAHSYFCLGVHVPPGVSIWGYMFIFEGTHILELFFHSKRIEAMKSDHLDVYNSDIIML